MTGDFTNTENMEAMMSIIGAFMVTKLKSEFSSSLDMMRDQVSKMGDHLEKLSSCEREDGYITKKEAVSYMGYSVNTFEKYQWNKSGIKIPSYGHAKNPRFKKSDLDMFMLKLNLESACEA